jgi:hypothetical protein
VIDGVEAAQFTNNNLDGTNGFEVENASICTTAAMSVEMYFVDVDDWDSEVGISITDSTGAVLYSLAYYTWENYSVNDQLLYSTVGVADCDDTDAASTFSDEDRDCDSIITAEDCDDSDASSNAIANDADCDGAITADDCDDNDETMNLDDVDGDTWTTCDGDCDDSDSSLNLDDVDGDTWSTCDSDCDDSDASLNLDDVDGDGVATCDTWLTFSDCYTVIANDSYGDGWDDSTLDFSVDGVLVDSLTILTDDDYDFVTFEVCVTDAFVVSIDYTDNTDWDSEVGFTITDQSGAVVIATASGTLSNYLDYTGNLAVIEEYYADCDDNDASVYENCTP